jgi:hypothetical protein
MRKWVENAKRGKDNIEDYRKGRCVEQPLCLGLKRNTQERNKLGSIFLIPKPG